MKATTVVLLAVWLSVCGMALAADAPAFAGKPAAKKAGDTTTNLDDWQKLNTQALADYAQPIRPGIPGRSPFWNMAREAFKYAPAFDFQPVEGAQHYRFTITQWEKDGKNQVGDKKWVFEAAEPWAPLTPVWNDLPVCTGSTANNRFRLKVEGLDRKHGRVVGLAKHGQVAKALMDRYLTSGYVSETYRDFRKDVRFGGPLTKPTIGFRTASVQNLSELLAKDASYAFFKEFRLPIEDARRSPACEAKGGKIGGWSLAAGLCIAESMAFLARETKNQEEAAAALKTATNAADSLINTSFPADWKCAFLSLHVDIGPAWSAYLKGGQPFDDWLKGVHNGIGAYRQHWNCRANEIGQAYLDVYDATRDTKYLEAAKRVADAYRNLQLPCGTWYDTIHPKTGEPTDKDALCPPATMIRFLDRLSLQYGIHDYEKTADRAFDWLMENQAKPFHFAAHFWDVPTLNRTQLYGDAGALASADAAVCLFNRAAKNPEYVVLGEDLLRFIEDQLISWDDSGRGYVSEQYGYMVKVGISGGEVADAYWRAFEATGKPLYLAKGLGVAYALLPKPYHPDPDNPPRVAVNLLEFNAFLKKHGLPGAE
jgi:hypothetical protein